MNPTFQYYPARIKSNRPIGRLNLNTFLSKIKTPTEKTIQLYVDINKADITGNLKKKAELKAKLFYFTPATYVIPCRRYSDIQSWTGLMPLDFDKIEYANEFRDYLITKHPYIIAAWLSASKKGVRAFVNIPVVNSVDEYKELFWGIRDVLEIYDGFDIAPQNCVLPLFLSYDPEIKIIGLPI